MIAPAPRGSRCTQPLAAKCRGWGFARATLRRARRLGVARWVRNGCDGEVLVHAEGPERAVNELIGFLRQGPAAARVGGVAIEAVAIEGHEQFAIRGISAGAFIVYEHTAGAHHFDLRLQVDGMMRSWALPKRPSMDPAARRLAVETGEQPIGPNAYGGASDDGRVIVWDRGHYEQGGRVAWPGALDRGHAVFALHGQRLQGGFVLQRTGRGEPARWLLIKRRDEHARAGSDVLAERPH